MRVTKKTKNTSGRRIALWVITIILIIVLAVAVLIAWGVDDMLKSQHQNEPEQSATTPQEILGEEYHIKDSVEMTFDLGNGLEVVKTGSYTGVYMEDGSDELVEGVWLIEVKNVGESYIQYAEVTLTNGNHTADFALSTLFPGESMIVLEKNRTEYSSETVFTTAMANNVAVFSAPPSLCEDKLQIQTLNGVVNIINISGEDISDDIVIYYKNYSDNLLYGGITYRVRIEGGLKKDAVKQIVSDHFASYGSRIMFVTIG